MQHGRMSRRSMSVAGDAIMQAATSAAAAGNSGILGSAVVGVPLRQHKPREPPVPLADGPEPVCAPLAPIPMPLALPESEGEKAVVVAGTSSDNPEPILSAGALVRKGDALGGGELQQDGQLMECRPLFEPMRSNAQGARVGRDMEPEIIIKTSFIAKLDGQGDKLEGAQGVNLAKFVQDHRALVLDFFRFEFRSNEDLSAFRRALGLPWYTRLPLALLLLLVLTGVALLFWLEYEVELANRDLDALRVPPAFEPDFSNQTLFVSTTRHFITPGQSSRVCRCVDWPFDPRIRYHATRMYPVERNAYFRYHSLINRTIIRSLELYTEPRAARSSRHGYCSRPGMGKNHACPYLPDGGSSLQLLWQWSAASQAQGYDSQAHIPTFGGYPMGASETGLMLLAIDYDASEFPAPIISTPFSFWDESGIAVELTARLHTESLKSLTLSNVHFATSPGRSSAKHCFALSTRAQNTRYAAGSADDATAASMRRHGKLSAVGWTVRTKASGVAVSLSAWRPTAPPHAQTDTDISMPNWSDEFSATYGNGSGLNASTTRDRAADHMDWQLLWSHEDSSFLPQDVRTYSMGAAGAGRCSCHADATFDAALRRCVDPTGEPLVDCGSVLQDGDVICTRCDYNASATLSSGFRPGEELCLAHLVVYPSEAVAQQQYTTRPSCRVGFTSTPTGCVDVDGPPPHVRRVSVLAGFVLRADGWFCLSECASGPCAGLSCADSTTAGGQHMFVPVGIGHRACRFTSDSDNQPSYFQRSDVAAFDRAACEALCVELDADTCRGYEYKSSTGACELWNVSPAASANAEGRECFARVGPVGTFSCV